MRADGGEVDRVEYQKWVAAGNKAKPFVPVKVTPRQARLALLRAGLLDQVDSMIAASDRETRITWSDASEIRRDFPLIAALGSALRLTSEQIDQLFIDAANL